MHNPWHAEFSGGLGLKLAKLGGKTAELATVFAAHAGDASHIRAMHIIIVAKPRHFYRSRSPR